ncbi:MAG: SoxR reducing system RseC family protein [Marinilabiliales bacterium]|nr:SoxR reducing system RseC family protein [Marinilabiliales bacterium]
MQKGETISHEGVVMRTTGDGTAEVEIMTGSACSGCHAKSACFSWARHRCQDYQCE